MYLAAASAAWRYSGNVTGPDSRLSRPRVTGVPVAFLAVPSAAARSGAALVDFDDDAVVELELAAASLLLLSLLLLPQPAAAKAPVTARAVRPAAHRGDDFMLSTSRSSASAGQAGAISCRRWTSGAASPR